MGCKLVSNVRTLKLPACRLFVAYHKWRRNIPLCLFLLSDQPFRVRSLRNCFRLRPVFVSLCPRRLIGFLLAHLRLWGINSAVLNKLLRLLLSKLCIGFVHRSLWMSSIVINQSCIINSDRSSIVFATTNLFSGCIPEDFAIGMFFPPQQESPNI